MQQVRHGNGVYGNQIIPSLKTKSPTVLLRSVIFLLLCGFKGNTFCVAWATAGLGRTYFDFSSSTFIVLCVIHTLLNTAINSGIYWIIHFEFLRSNLFPSFWIQYYIAPKDLFYALFMAKCWFLRKNVVWWFHRRWNQRYKFLTEFAIYLSVRYIFEYPRRRRDMSKMRLRNLYHIATEQSGVISHLNKVKIYRTNEVSISL